MKKFLSLVMALAMVMSLTVVSTSAKDFADGDSITYDEAIDVISALEIMDGYTDGSFQPNTQLNRGQAAKIICNLILGVATADNLSATRAPFPDVPASHHFAGYISYCAQEGIISGYSDGYFRPGDTLSGYAFMKMLLGALGYEQKNEGLTGSNWTIQCAKLVQGIGLDADLDGDFIGSKTVTREEAALYALNTLKARTVEYVVPGGSFTVNGVEINQKASNASYRTYDSVSVSQGAGQAKNDGNIASDGYVQFAEEHFPRLVLTTSEADGFGRPQHTWTYKGDKVGSYTDTPDATYEAFVTMADLYDDLSLTSTTKYFKVFIDGTIPSNFYPLGDVDSDDKDYAYDEGPSWNEKWDSNEVTYNGKDYDILEIDDNSVADVERIGVGPGCTIEVFKSGVAYNDDTKNETTKGANAVKTSGTIVVTNTYVGEVVSVNEAEGKHAANIEIAPVGDFYEEATTISEGSKILSDVDTYDFTFNTDKFDVGDIVTFNYQYNNKASKASVKNVAVAETVEGEVKDFTDQESFTLDSTEYKYSKMAPEKVKSEDINTNIVAYLDKQGNVLYFDEGKDNNKNFALVLDAGTRSAVGGNSFEAELLFSDGSTKLVTTDKRYGATNFNTDNPTEGDGGNAKDTCMIGEWVTYRENSKGQYVLTAINKNTEKSNNNLINVGTHLLNPLTAGLGDGDFVIGDTSVTGNSAASNVDLNGTKYRVNGSTLIIVKTKADTFKVYNGVKELPLITVVAEYKTQPNAKILYSVVTRANQSYARFLYIDASATHTVNGDKLIDVRNRTNNDIFLVGNASQKYSVDSAGNTYYAFKGVVDGTITQRIKLNWNDKKTQEVIGMLLDPEDRANSGIALSNYSLTDGLYEVEVADEFTKVSDLQDNDKGAVVEDSVDKVTAEVVQVDGDKGLGETFDLADGCKFFRVDGNSTNLRVVERTWQGLSKGDVGADEENDKYSYVALSLNRDYEVTAVYWRLTPSK